MKKRAAQALTATVLLLTTSLGLSPGVVAQEDPTLTPTPVPSPTAIASYLIGFRVEWDNGMDLDLVVYQTSIDEIIYWDNRTSSTGGALDSSAGNDFCRDVAARPFETITWSGGAPRDEYAIQVQISLDCDVTQDPQFTLFTVWSDSHLETLRTGHLSTEEDKWTTAYSNPTDPPTPDLLPYGPLDPNLEPVYGSITLDPGGFYQEMVIGGAINLGETADTAFQGFIQANPHLCFASEEAPSQLWIQTMYGHGDPVLIVVDPLNRWWYNDDAGAEIWLISETDFEIREPLTQSDSLDPLIILDRPPQGRYCLWLGSMTGGHFQTHLRISLQEQ